MFASAKSEPILDTGSASGKRDRVREQIARITAALRLPAEAFYEEPATCVTAANTTSTDARQALELLGLFDTITDKTQRQACLDFVRAAVERNVT